MKKLFSLFATLSLFAFPAFGEAYGQWYDQDGGVCDDGPGSIQFNEGFVTLNIDGFPVTMVEVGSRTSDDGKVTLYEVSPLDDPGAIFQFVIDHERGLFVDPVGEMPVVPCDTPEPSF